MSGGTVKSEMALVSIRNGNFVKAPYIQMVGCVISMGPGPLRVIPVWSSSEMTMLMFLVCSLAGFSLVLFGPRLCGLIWSIVWYKKLEVCSTAMSARGAEIHARFRPLAVPISWPPVFPATPGAVILADRRGRLTLLTLFHMERNFLAV